ncbi:LpxI family protein [Pelagibacterium lacus]|uniref:LpxI family protein n=1 Tax=Pelagibacterium lacus TaxID=2282655 RepID=A0A369W257_9HYPH|nr:UDP-2,3-diacylglucosamine diphosphatase LpxI [Pelagibacterium lacus]RDE07965.1 LpxI family protein [Pelagibacterium lacus]
MTGKGRLALVVGSGDLVPQAIEAARAAGWEVRVLSLHERDDLAAENPFQIKVSRPDQVLREIRAFKATHVCAVGGFHMSDRERETFAEFAGDREARSRGDGKLSQLGSALLKMLGLPFIGVHEIVRDLLAPEGVIGAVTSDDDLLRVMNFAFDAVRRAGTFDLGQALVVAGQRVIATEDIAGTDELLHRCAALRQRGLIGDGRATLVLAKSSKPGQPLHVDMPAVGPQTIAGAIEAGIVAIVVEAGRTLMINREEMVARADAAGIALFGIAARDG